MCVNTMAPRAMTLSIHQYREKGSLRLRGRSGRQEALLCSFWPDKKQAQPVLVGGLRSLLTFGFSWRGEEGDSRREGTISAHIQELDGIPGLSAESEHISGGTSDSKSFVFNWVFKKSHWKCELLQSSSPTASWIGMHSGLQCWRESQTPLSTCWFDHSRVVLGKSLELLYLLFHSYTTGKMDSPLHLAVVRIR